MISVEQSLRMQAILSRCLNSSEDAKELMLGIESVVETKFLAEKIGLATKEDMRRLELDIRGVEIRMEQGFKEMLKWMIVLMFGFASFIIAVIKLTD